MQKEEKEDEVRRFAENARMNSFTRTMDEKLAIASQKSRPNSLRRTKNSARKILRRSMVASSRSRCGAARRRRFSTRGRTASLRRTPLRRIAQLPPPTLDPTVRAAGLEPPAMSDRKSVV